MSGASDMNTLQPEIARRVKNYGKVDVAKTLPIDAFRGSEVNSEVDLTFFFSTFRSTGPEFLSPTLFNLVLNYPPYKYVQTNRKA